MNKSLTLKRLKELVHYNPETGIFVRLVGTKKSPRGSIVADGQRSEYLQVGFKVGDKDSIYCLHTLAWLYVTGEWPDGPVDHIDGNTRNNRISNLRLIDKRGNAENMSPTRDTRSGVTGVSWDGYTGRWRAKIRTREKTYCLGRFSSIDAAKAAYLSAKASLHKGYNPERWQT